MIDRAALRSALSVSSKGKGGEGLQRDSGSFSSGARMGKGAVLKSIAGALISDDPSRHGARAETGSKHGGSSKCAHLFAAEEQVLCKEIIVRCRCRCQVRCNGMVQARYLTA